MIAITLTLCVIFQAARMAMTVFDPYLSSFAIAERLLEAPPGNLIAADAYYAFSSVFFYTGRNAFLWNGRINNLEYGSYAPGAPGVFLDDRGLKEMWNGPSRQYMILYGSDLDKFKQATGMERPIVVTENSGSYLLTNHSLALVAR